MRACVVLPAFNEEGNVTPLVNELIAVAHRAGLDLSVVAVDDGSRDGTLEALRKLAALHDKIHVVDHGVNRGFARALKTGIAEALRRGFDVVVLMDCDQTHDARDLPRLIGALDDGHQVALGSRFVPGGGMHGVPAWRRAISRAGNALGKALLGIPVHDFTTGYRVFRQEVLRGLVLEEDGFGIQLESTVKAYAAGYSLVEVPTVLKGRSIGTSSMHYNVSLFASYLRLLGACRRWLRQAGAVAGHERRARRAAGDKGRSPS